MVPSSANTLFDATIPFTSLRPLSRILVALAKLGDELSFEVTPSQVLLSTMNLSKSAFGMIKLDSRTFFTSYNCPDPTNHRDVVVRCKMQTRLLLGIFKARNTETRENKDSSPESCQIKVIDNPQTGVCRFIIRLLCKHGVVKTHQLAYSPSQSLYALYDKSRCTQHFEIQSKIAKEYLDHFQSKIEEVDIYVEGDKLILNGFTEGFTGDDSQLLKQPLQTQVSLSTGELDDYSFHERVHILLTLRDLKAAVSLAESLGVPVQAFYSTPGHPFVINLDRKGEGIACEFIISTVPESGPSQSPGVQTLLNTQIRRPSMQRDQQSEERMVVDEEAAMGWGDDRGMSPARSSRIRQNGDEDLYGESMHLEEEEEEVPPTQQERYQGIFDI